MAAPFVKAHQFMASDDLTAPNAVGVDQDKINSLDRRIVAQKLAASSGLAASLGSIFGILVISSKWIQRRQRRQLGGQFA